MSFLILHEPSERKLEEKFVRKYGGDLSKLVAQQDFCYNVDLLKSIESLLQIDSVVDRYSCVYFDYDTGNFGGSSECLCSQYCILV